MSKTSSRFKNFDSIVIKDDQFEKRLRIHLLTDNVNVSSLLCYLKSNGWMNYKFNEYSIKSEVNEQGTTTVVTLGYIPPVLNFK